MLNKKEKRVNTFILNILHNQNNLQTTLNDTYILFTSFPHKTLNLIYIHKNRVVVIKSSLFMHEIKQVWKNWFLSKKLIFNYVRTSWQPNLKNKRFLI